MTEEKRPDTAVYFSRRNALFCLALLAAILLMYYGTIKRPMDKDGVYLTYGSAFVRDPYGIPKFFTTEFFAGSLKYKKYTFVTGYYRPVTNTAFWLQYRIAGKKDSIYNITQRLMHWVNSCLVFFLCLLLFGNRLMAATASVLFAVHPINTFVAIIPAALSDSLFFFFYLSTIAVYFSAMLSGSGRGTRYGVAAALALFLLAILSKESSSTLPVTLFALHLYLHYRHGIPFKSVFRTVPFWLLLGAYFVWRFLILDIWPVNVGYTDVYPPYVVYLNLAKNVPIYLLRILLPHGAEYNELFPILVNFVDPSVKDPMIYLGLALIFIFAGLAVFLWKRSPMLAFLTTFFLITLIPLIGVNNITSYPNYYRIPVEERFIYLPGVALFMFIGYGCSLAYKKYTTTGRRWKLALTAASMAVIFLGWTSSVHAQNVNTDYGLLRQYYLFPEERLTVVDRMLKLIIYSHKVAIPLGQLDEAEKRIKQAMALVPASPLPVVALSAVLIERGKWKELVELLGPWYHISDENLAKYYKSNPNVIHDILRSNQYISFFFAKGAANLGNGKEAVKILCEAMRQGHQEKDIQKALYETYALNGPSRCIEAEDKGKCIEDSPAPDFPEWELPLEPDKCQEWESKL